MVVRVLGGRRSDVIADSTLGGRALCSALSTATDELLVALFDDAASQRRVRARVALVAVGGYGRRELAPQSDVDALVLYEGRDAKGVDELASAVWYPLWDAGVRLGHGVRSVDEQLSLADGDIETATAMLSVRWLAGDDELADRVANDGLAQWRRRGRRWLGMLREQMAERRDRAGDVAFLLEPDLKDGRGGLRDVHALRWAADADLLVPPADVERVERCHDTLLAARVALHRVTGRPGDTLRLEDQDAVAVVAGAPSADALMADVAAAARSISWLADEAWERGSRHTVGAPRRLAQGIVELGGEIDLAPRADPAADPVLVLRAAGAAARSGARIARSCLDRLSDDLTPWDGPWPDGGRDELVALLLEGHRAIRVMETLEQRDLLVRLLPEWAPVRSRPQRNAYHRFTVDRHLWEAAANAADLAGRVGRPDLLVVGALLHDLGKGSPGDHTVAGMELISTIGERIGFDADDVATLVAMVEHHLLLPDVAVRRDLEDPATIAHVAGAVGSVERLELLHALTEADSLATGPAAWGRWKEQLVAELVARVHHVLAGGDVGDVAGRAFPDEPTRAAMAAGDVAFTRQPDDERDPAVERLTVVYPDVPGSFARVAGVLSLHGVDVLAALAAPGSPGGGVADTADMAASQFRVLPPPAGVDWAALVSDLRRALAGELAIEARLAQRARTYRRRRATRAAPPGEPSVEFHDAASGDASVIEIRAPDRIGMLHRIAAAMNEVGLDIRHATVQTLGEEVVDTFYVRNRAGSPVTDPFHRAEVERAVLHAVDVKPPR